MDDLWNFEVSLKSSKLFLAVFGVFQIIFGIFRDIFWKFLHFKASLNSKPFWKFKIFFNHLPRFFMPFCRFFWAIFGVSRSFLVFSGLLLAISGNFVIFNSVWILGHVENTANLENYESYSWYITAKEYKSAIRTFQPVIGLQMVVSNTFQRTNRFEIPS